VVVAMNPAERERLIKCFGLLGSDYDGEVGNAGRLAHRIVKDLGRTWAEIIMGTSKNKCDDRRSRSQHGRSFNP
jgi:hypothetical protein